MVNVIFLDKNIEELKNTPEPAAFRNIKRNILAYNYRTDKPSRRLFNLGWVLCPRGECPAIINHAAFQVSHIGIFNKCLLVFCLY